MLNFYEISVKSKKLAKQQNSKEQENSCGNK